MKVLWTQKAYDRLEEIFGYIEIDSPDNARKWVSKLFTKVEHLSASPKLGRKVPELGSSHIRELIFGNYRVIYRIAGETIYILTIRHFKQILPVDDME